MRQLAALFVLCLFPSANEARAQEPNAPCRDATHCPRPSKFLFNLICSNVSSRSKDEDEDSPFLYRYEKTLWAMAGAKAGTDSADTARARIQVLWDRYHDDFVCDTAGLHNANILRYAVYNNFTQFLMDFMGYGLNVNYRDTTDGRTILDYVRDHRDSIRQVNPTTAQLRDLGVMYTLLRKANAKHSAELPRH